MVILAEVWTGGPDDGKSDMLVEEPANCKVRTWPEVIFVMQLPAKEYVRLLACNVCELALPRTWDPLLMTTPSTSTGAPAVVRAVNV